MRTVLVTGALGGIGSAIITRLAELGDTVIATDRAPAEHAQSGLFEFVHESLVTAVSGFQGAGKGA